MSDSFGSGPSENWIARNWHPACAAVYLAICLMDFLCMPVYYEIDNAHLTPTKTVELAMMLKDGAAQIEALKVLHQDRSWTPITLGQNGLFHLAFGAILGVGIWSRGKQGNTQVLNDISAQIATVATSAARMQPSQRIETTSTCETCTRTQA